MKPRAFAQYPFYGLTPFIHRQQKNMKGGLRDKTFQVFLFLFFLHNVEFLQAASKKNVADVDGWMESLIHRLS